MKKKFLSTALLSIISLGSANAALVLDITGISGSGQTTWTFSGSSVATASGYFNKQQNLNNLNTWSNIGEYTGASDLEVLGIVSSATLTVNADTRNIDLAYIDSDGAFGSGKDDIGVGVDGIGPSDFFFNSGDLVSWGGSLTANVDINQMNTTGLPFSFTTSRYGNQDDTLEIQGTISETTVPTPSAFLFLSAGLVGLLASNRKRKNRV